jgi:hypothetical protein
LDPSQQLTKDALIWNRWKSDGGPPPEPVRLAQARLTAAGWFGPSN